MTLQYFDIGVDPDGTEYIFQAVDEADKNHSWDDSEQTNAAKMYKNRDKYIIKNVKN